MTHREAPRPTTGRPTAAACPPSSRWPPAPAPRSRPPSRGASSAPPSRRLDVTVVEEPTGRRLGRGGPTDAPAPARRVLRPGRPRRPDRLRRGLPDRRVGRRRPGRLPHRARPPGSRRWSRSSLQRLRALVTPRAARPPAQHRGQQPGQHLAPLRPVQRALRALPRRDAELFVRALRHLRHRAGTAPAPSVHLVATPPEPTDTAGPARPQPRPRRGAGPQDRAPPRRGRRHRRHPGARDRHRLGRARHPRRPARRDRPHDHAVGRAARARRAADRRGRASPTGSTSS